MDILIPDCYRMKPLPTWTTMSSENSHSDVPHNGEGSCSDDHRSGYDSIDARNDFGVSTSSTADANGAEETRQKLAEQENLIRSVNWLGRHVPVCVLNRLGKEIILEDEEEAHSIRGDSSSESHVSALSDDEGSDQSEDEFLAHAERGILGSLKEEDDEDSKIEEESVSLMDEDKRLIRQNSSISEGARRGEVDNLDLSSSLEFDINDELKTYIENGASPGSNDRSTKRLSSKLEKLKLPYASKHDCALLYVDISGFTKLSKLLDPESLSEVINSYFHMIVDEVTSLGGDILKFAGDALFAQWQAVSDASDEECTHDGIPHSIDPAIRMSLPDCVAIAATCGANIVSKCSDFPVFARKGRGTSRIGETAQVATLNVHCGLGAGKVVGIHVGDNESRREFLVLGEPIKQSTEAANRAALGEFLTSPEALAVMSETCHVDERLLSNVGRKVALIATKSSASFILRRPKMQRRCSVTHLWEGWNAEMLQQYRKLISLYVHPVVVNNDIAASNSPRRKSSIEERHSEEAELRSVYVMFVNMTTVRARISGNTKEDLKLFRLLNDIMELTTRELNRFRGHLRQFIVDDKGLVIIATFGLRGSTFPNMVTERALPATTVIHNALQSELGVDNRIGATLGNAYCGLVGGVKRHEFAVLGPSVNLAARLMTNKSNPGILVDDAIRLNAGKSYGFNALDPVQAKGFSSPVPIFEPLSSIERGWGKVKSSFVGRKSEIKKLVSIARDISSSGTAPAKIVFVTAESGTGKSSMVVHAIAHIRKVVGRKKKRVLIAKHVCRESDRLVPFSMLRSILPDVLDEINAWQDDSSVTTSNSKVSASGMTWASANDSDAGIQWDGLSVASSVTSSSGVYASPDRLLHVCREMNAPPEFVELVGHHLLGLDLAKVDAAYSQERSKKPPSLQAIVNLMVQAFQMCTRRATLVVLALDDVHQMDEMSWKVLYKLFITSKNLLIICTSQPLTKYKLTIEERFWKALNTKYKGQHRFIPMNLHSLGEGDIRSFLARELGVQESEISERFHHDVFMQTGGMPHFANEILQDLKRRKIVGMGADNLFGWQDSEESKSELAPASIGELIVHRVDSFDPTVRNVLNLGAVLGDSFELLEIITVLQELDGATRSQEIHHAENIIQALNLLVNEGILRQVFEGGEDDLFQGGNVHFGDHSLEKEGAPTFPLHHHKNPFMEKIENREYTFCNDLWRSSILKLMLDSRKKDIHRTIAMTLEAQQVEDYESRIKLFGHWKASGNFSKAASLSLRLGTSFEKLGLHHQSIQLYEDTLAMWKGANQFRETVGGFSAQLLDSVGVADLEYSVKLHIAMGHCLANIHKAAESVAAYQNALEILQAAPAAKDIKDRSIAFPLFSGLFVALKCGTMEQDEEYEKALVHRFVNETRLNGDPVHYSRALAMQGEMQARLGNFDKAFEAHRELAKVYSVDDHSTAICKEYGSDRSGQSFGASALWYMQQNNMDEALRTCWYVIDELMPKMERRNVHNSFVMLYPVLWVMKKNGLALEARKTFVKYVVDPFNEYFGEGAFTFFLPLYEPIMMLLDLTWKLDAEVEKFDEYVNWASNVDNLRFGTVINNATGNLGRCSDSLSAEICLLLAKRADEWCTKVKMVRNGISVARECVELTDSKGKVISRQQVKAVFDELDLLAKDMKIEV